MIAFLLAGILSCGSGSNGADNSQKKDQSELVKKRREDGTLSSVNPVDEDGYVHGVKVNYYEDGKTVHSKVSYEHGRKHGPAIWYFKNGQIYEHTTFNYGRKQGLTKRYYDSGVLMEEITYEMGEEVPGTKKYNKRGELISQ